MFVKKSVLKTVQKSKILNRFPFPILSMSQKMSVIDILLVFCHQKEQLLGGQPVFGKVTVVVIQPHKLMKIAYYC